MSVQSISAAFAYSAPSPTAKLVLLALANYADENDQCFPSVRRISSETGLSERAVRNAIKALTDCRAVTKEARRRRDGTQTTDLFTLNIQAAPNAVSQAAPGAVSAPDRLHDVPQQTAPRAPLTTFEPPLEPSLKPREALVEQIWSLQPIVGGKRKAGRPDIRAALDAAIKRRGDPDAILSALTAYYRLPDCRKDGGQYARGAAVMLNADRWRDFLPDPASQTEAGPVAPAVIASRLGRFRDTGVWEPEWGPKPAADIHQGRAA